MKNLSIGFILFFLTIPSFAQETEEQSAVKATINLIFDGMRKSDTSMIRKAFSDQITMQTIAKNKEGNFVVRNEKLTDFLKSIATPHAQPYNEKIVFDKILIDANLASVWTSYKFYVGETFSHCGVNSFQLFKDKEGWKIIYLIDTRRKDPCN